MAAEERDMDMSLKRASSPARSSVSSAQLTLSSKRLVSRRRISLSVPSVTPLKECFVVAYDL